MANRDISKKTLWLTITIVSLIILSYTIFQINKINRENKPYTGTRNNNSTKKPIRVPLYMDPRKVVHESRFQFTYDPPDVLKPLRESENLDHVVAGIDNDFDKAIKLMFWCRSQFDPGKPDPYPPINGLIILKEIRAGRTGGFCAQYNFLFVQALQSFSIKARYVTIHDHEVTEVWISKYKKWICFDPLYNCYYSDINKTPLSVYQLFRHSRENIPIQIVGEQKYDTPKDHLDRFKGFAVWLKNNHISSPVNFADLQRYKLYFIDPEDLSDDIPVQDLFTTFPEDFNVDPTK